MINYIIVALVIVAFLFAARHAVQTFSGKKSCCGGGSTDSGKTFRAVKIEDTNKANYPYSADFKISGMHCDNCARNVTNALDSIKGTWATVDLASKNAHVLSKNPIDKDAYKNVVSEAGYRVIA